MKKEETKQSILHKPITISGIFIFVFLAAAICLFSYVVLMPIDHMNEVNNCKTALTYADIQNDWNLRSCYAYEAHFTIFEKEVKCTCFVDNFDYGHGFKGFEIIKFTMRR